VLNLPAGEGWFLRKSRISHRFFPDNAFLYLGPNTFIDRHFTKVTFRERA